MFPRQLDFNVKRSAITNTMTPDISLTVVTNIYSTAVFSKELTDRMITGDAAVLTERNNDLVLQFGFWIH